MVTAESRAYHHAYYLAHREQRRDKDKAYHLLHRDKHLAYLRDYYQQRRKIQLVSVYCLLYVIAYHGVRHPEIFVLFAAARVTEVRKKHALQREKHREVRRAHTRMYAKTARGLESNKMSKARRRAWKAGTTVASLTAAQWREIKAAYGFRCVYCARKMRRLTMEHLTPLSKGGRHDVHNVVPACHACNSRKQAGPLPKPVQPLLLTLIRS